MAARKRANVEAATMAAIIAPHCRVPDFMNYSETLKSKLNKSRIEAVGVMWQQIANHTKGKLAFSQSFMETVFRHVRGLAEKTWQRNMLDTEVDDWAAVSARQFRTMARHLSNSLKYTWAQKVLGGCEDEAGEGEGDEAGEGGGEGGEEEEPTVDEEVEPEQEAEEEEATPDVKMKRPAAASDSDDLSRTTKRPATASSSMDGSEKKRQRPATAAKADDGAATYTYGYDKETQNGWRRSDKKSAKPQMAMKFNTDLADDAHPIATFADGSEVVIQTVTVKDIKAHAQFMLKSRGKLWEQGDHSISHKKDRSPMLVLHGMVDGATKQLCQIHIRHFGDPTSEVRRTQKQTGGVNTLTT